jgi:uncharacterized protein YwgA
MALSIEQKKEFILKIFSIIKDYKLSPVRLQNFFFLLEKRIGEEAKFFDFEPYYYGTYCQELKDIVAELEKEGNLKSSNVDGIQHFVVAKPFNFNKLDNFLDRSKREFISSKLVEFVTSMSFRDLCFSIYKEFPDMAKRDVLRGFNSK